MFSFRHYCFVHAQTTWNLTQSRSWPSPSRSSTSSTKTARHCRSSPACRPCPKLCCIGERHGPHLCLAQRRYIPTLPHSATAPNRPWLSFGAARWCYEYHAQSTGGLDCGTAGKERYKRAMAKSHEIWRVKYCGQKSGGCRAQGDECTEAA